MAIPYAFVTLLTSDSYLDGALTLAAALRDVHPSPAAPPEVDFQTVCLVTPETVDVSTTKLLRRSFDIVIGVEVIAQKDDKNLQLLGEHLSLFAPHRTVRRARVFAASLDYIRVLLKVSYGLRTRLKIIRHL